MQTCQYRNSIDNLLEIKKFYFNRIDCIRRPKCDIETPKKIIISKIEKHSPTLSSCLTEHQ
jgi:hypothetical protein